MPPRLVREPRTLPLVLAALLALAVAPELPSPAPRPTAGWRGWYAVVCHAAAAPVVEASLRQADPRSISRTSATVKIDAFSSIEALPVAELDARLDPLDPRRDAWLAGVGGYFRAEDAGVELVTAYVEATRGRLATRRRLARAFDASGVPRDGWRLADLEPLATLARPAAALCFAIALAWWLRRGAPRSMALAAIGALAWLPGLLNGGLPDLCVCCASLYLWLPRATAPERDPGGRLSPEPPGRTAMRIGVLLAVTAAAIAADGAALYRTARTTASALELELLAAAWPLLRPRTPKRSARRRFAPVPIRAPRRSALAPFAAGLAAFGIAAAPLCRPQLRMPLPTPVSLARAGSRRGIEAAARSAGPASLPGLAEAVGHAASLQMLAFTPVVGDGMAAGRRTPPPPRDARVRIRGFTEGADGVSLVETPVTVARFESGWLERLVAGFPVGALEGLLLDQHRAVVVRVRALRAGLSGTMPVALLVFALLGAPLAGPSARRLLMRLGLWAITEPAHRRRTR